MFPLYLFPSLRVVLRLGKEQGSDSEVRGRRQMRGSWSGDLAAVSHVSCGGHTGDGRSEPRFQHPAPSWSPRDTQRSSPEGPSAYLSHLSDLPRGAATVPRSVPIAILMIGTFWKMHLQAILSLYKYHRVGSPKPGWPQCC